MQLSVDIGGTFTDFAYFDEKGKLQGFKLPSVPKDPSGAIKSGLKLLPGSPTTFLHGTTIATNTVLERSGSLTAFVTTKGFKDILHIGRQVRPSLYDFTIIRKPPLVPRRLCFELNERVDANGKILVDLQEDELKVLAEKLKKAGVEAVGVGLLFSYLNPKHEKMVGRFLRKILKIPVTLSSEILPEFREFERCSTTVMNAYLMDRVGSYITNLKRTMARVGLKEFYIMQSSGGVTLSKIIRTMPVRTLLSGPAAGVSATAKIGRDIGEPNLISFDMGGTSADVAAIVENDIVWTPDGEIDSLPLKIPMVEIETIGAGGGSIAWIDDGGALRVGPRSAGADPGPVCYNRGGRDITVTDANLLLGIIHPSFFLGGQFILNENAVQRYAQRFAMKLGFGIREMAQGVCRVVEANMLRAVKRVSVEKGLEPRRFGLVAFGGAGPIHASSIARELKVPRVIVPVSPGTFSAYGLLVSDIKLDYTRTFLSDMVEKTKFKKVDVILNEHKKSAISALKAQGIPLKRAEFYPTLDLRYKGQSYEVNVPLKDTISATIENFHELHENRFGYCMPRSQIELVNVRLAVKAVRPEQGPTQRRAKRSKSGSKLKLPSPIKLQKVFIDGNNYNTPLFDRSYLQSGMELKGPAVIADSGSTALILPGMSGEIDSYGNLIIMI
jgi:N-methylhydantoinase A